MRTSPVSEPQAIDVTFPDDSRFVVHLADGRELAVPVAWYPRLANAELEDRKVFEITGRGYGIHWPRIDEDLSIAGLLRGEHAV